MAPSVATTQVERSILQEETEQADTGPAVTEKGWQGVSEPSPTVGQRGTKQAPPVALEGNPWTDQLDARPTERCVLTGLAVVSGESERSGDGGVRLKEQPDVGSMVRGDVIVNQILMFVSLVPNDLAAGFMVC